VEGFTSVATTRPIGVVEFMLEIKGRRGTPHPELTNSFN
jgi:hypothetical protein